METPAVFRIVIGLLLLGSVTFFATITGIFPSMFVGGVVFLIGVVAFVGRYWYHVRSSETPQVSPSDFGWGLALRGWIAFCTGYWLAGFVLAAQHFLELFGRGHHSFVEVIGVPLVVGLFLPGARPFTAAADVLGVAGLPIGFSAIFVGVLLGAIVWVTLPMLIHHAGARPEADVTTGLVIASAVPYIAGAAGIGYLSRVSRRNGHAMWGPVAKATAAALVGYLLVAGCLFIFAVAFLSR